MERLFPGSASSLCLHLQRPPDNRRVTVKPRFKSGVQMDTSGGSKSCTAGQHREHREADTSSFATAHTIIFTENHELHPVTSPFLFIYHDTTRGRCGPMTFTITSLTLVYYLRWTLIVINGQNEATVTEQLQTRTFICLQLQ